MPLLTDATAVRSITSYGLVREIDSHALGLNCCTAAANMGGKTSICVASLELDRLVSGANRGNAEFRAMLRM